MTVYLNTQLACYRKCISVPNLFTQLMVHRVPSGSLVRWPPPASLESGACHLRSKPMLQVSLGWKDLNFENKRPVSPGFIVQKLNLTAKTTLVGATTTKLRASRDFATTRLPLCFSAFVASTWLSTHQFECLNGCERKEKRPLFFSGQRIWRSQQVSSGKKKEETNLTIQRRIRRIKHVRKKKGEGAAHSAVSRHHKAKLKLQSTKKTSSSRDTTSRESITMPVARHEAYRDKPAWIATYMAGTLNVSNLIASCALGRPDSSYFPSRSKSAGMYWGKTGQILPSSPNTFAMVEPPPWYRRRWCQRSQLLGRALVDPLDHGGTTRRRRTSPCGCQRRTSWCSGETCRGTRWPPYR